MVVIGGGEGGSGIRLLFLVDEKVFSFNCVGSELLDFCEFVGETPFSELFLKPLHGVLGVLRCGAYFLNA